jgi:hypothetical protein
MKKLLQEMIEMLKNQVKHNLEIINRNEDVIRNLTEHPESEEHIVAFQQYYIYQSSAYPDKIPDKIQTFGTVK